MTLGEKIRKARKEKKITQESLVSGQITRNMLSAIESGKANPSLDTLTYIAKQLSLPLSYLLSDDDDLFFYAKSESIGEILDLYKNKKYQACINKVLSLGGVDDELAYILATSYFELGRRSVLFGALRSGGEQLALAGQYSKMTIYNTSKEKALIPLYSALAKNIQSPLLEFDNDEFEKNLPNEYDFELLKYINQESGYNYKTPIFKNHISARRLMKERKYKEAINIMREIEEKKTQDSYNSYVIFSIYCDLENCYKQLGDFENAYRYASKRLSLIEGFQT